MDIEHIPFVISQEERNHADYIYFPNVFSPGECAEIIKIGKSLNLESSRLRDGDTNEEHRNSKNSWIGNNLSTSWIYLRLSDYLLEANSQFRYDLSYFGEPLQFTEYEPGGMYNWHQDTSSGATSVRKLSMVVNLTDPSRYVGGEFQLFSCMKDKIPNYQGGVLIFPSFKDHRVCPVKEGVRHSLVAWISGPPFR